MAKTIFDTLLKVAIAVLLVNLLGGCATCPAPYERYAREVRQQDGKYILWCEVK
jgi:hypothetical protein